MTQGIAIDLNADMGEFPDQRSAARDRELMRYVTSVNVACGGHAGDELTIRQTVLSAKAHGVAVGAHPSYPDQVNFGRVEMEIPLSDLQVSLEQQVRLVADIAKREGIRIRHVKPHGALYHAANRIEAIALTVASAVISVDPGLIVVGQSGSTALAVYQRLGLRQAAEAFVDRRYERDGSLRDRRLAGALLDSAKLALQQALQITLQQSVATLDGTLLPIQADTICLHSDTPESETIARTVRTGLIEAGVHVRSFC